MTTTVITEYSLYEVDQDGSQIRRLSGARNPLPSQGEDGEWKKYETLEFLGNQLLITWGYDDHNILRRTRTSEITDVQGDALNIHEYGSRFA